MIPSDKISAKQKNHFFDFNQKEFVDIFLALVLYYVLSVSLNLATSLNEAIFYGDSILVEALANSKRYLLAAGTVCIFTLLTFRLTWVEIDRDYSIRILIFTAIAVIVWMRALYAFNFYYQQSHLSDRFLLLILGVAVFFRPAFIFLFVLVASSINRQFYYPFAINIEWTDIIFYQLFILLGSYLMVYRYRKDMGSHTFIFLAYCLILSNYFIPGITKILISPHYYEWYLYDKVVNFSASAYLNGWEIWGNEDTLFDWLPVLNRYQLLFTLATFIVEIGSVIAFLHRNIFLGLIILRLLFHIGVFLLTGDSFWNWIVLNTALLIHFWYLDISNKILLFKSFHLKLLSIICISAGVYLFQARDGLGWFDSKYSNYYQMYAENSEGEQEILEGSIFSPYDIYFMKTHFYFLHRDSILSRTYGSVKNYNLYAALDSMTNVQYLGDIKKRFGKSEFDEQKTVIFEEVLKRYFATKKSQQSFFYDFLQPPLHLYTMRQNAGVLSKDEKIVKIIIRYREVYFSGEKFIFLKDSIVSQIKIN